MPPRNERSVDCRELLAELETLIASRRGTTKRMGEQYARLYNKSEQSFAALIYKLRRSGQLSPREAGRFREVMGTYDATAGRLRGKAAAEALLAPEGPEPVADFDGAFTEGTLPGPIVDSEWLLVRPEDVPEPETPGRWWCFACGELVQLPFGSPIRLWQWVRLCERCFYYPVLPPPARDLNLWHASRGRYGAPYTADEVDTYLDGLAQSLEKAKPPRRRPKPAGQSDGMPTTDAEQAAFDRALDERLTAHHAGELDLDTAEPLRWRHLVAVDATRNGYRRV